MRAALPLLFAALLGGCLGNAPDHVYAPGVARGGENADQLAAGHRLMEAGEYELALDAFTRAAAEQGLNADTLSALGSANLRLGRLGQAETLLRRAVAEDDGYAQAWNNLGVLLMERGQIAEAAQAFRRAFATSNGQSVAIRDNLRLALAKLENAGYSYEEDTSGFQLVQRGGGKYLLTRGE